MLQARDIMTTDVKTVRVDLPVSDLEAAFIAQGVSGFPVLDGERLVGVVSRSDVIRKLAVEASISGQLSDYYRETGGERAAGSASARAEAAEAGIRMGGTSVADVMCRSVVSVGADDSVQHVARLMTAQGFHRLPVLDGGRLAGIITSLDLVQVVAELGVGAAQASPETSLNYFARLRDQHARLRAVLRRLESALGDGPRELDGPLAELVELLPAHYATEERGGYLTEVLQVAPRLSDRASRLESDHARLTATVRELRTALREGVPHDELQVRTRGFLQDLRAHEDAESELVGEAFRVELGSTHAPANRRQ